MRVVRAQGAKRLSLGRVDFARSAPRGLAPKRCAATSGSVCGHKTRYARRIVTGWTGRGYSGPVTPAKAGGVEPDPALRGRAHSLR